MKFQYTPHAKEKLAERKLDIGLIEDVVINPERIEETKLNRKIASRTIGSKVLLVVYEEEHNAYIIITAYYVEKGRYL